MAAEKDGEEPSAGEGDFSQWEGNFNAYLHRDKVAQAALGELLSRGCQRQTVIRLVYDYCRDTSASEDRIAAARWKAITELLGQIALKLNEVVPMLQEEAETPEPIHDVVHLLKFLEEYLKIVLPQMEPQTNVRKSLGKALHLVRLSLYIQGATGNYLDRVVAALVVAGLQGGHQEEDFNGNAVNKTRTRLKKRNAVAYELFEQETAKYFEQFQRHGDPESKPPFLEWCETARKGTRNVP